MQAAWCGEQFPRAAEIIRYTYDGWAAADVERFKKMLATQYVPILLEGSCQNGNKELSMAAALINIGVFNDDRETFDRGVKMWRGRAPAYIYLSSDGPQPLKAAGCDDMPIWGNKGKTTPLRRRPAPGERARFRPREHGALVDGQRRRDRAAARHRSLRRAGRPHLRGAGVPGAVPSAEQRAAGARTSSLNAHPTWEIAFNHYHNRLGRPLPKMAAVLPTIRPTGWNHQMAWETLTHAEVKDAGLPPVAARRSMVRSRRSFCADSLSKF